MPKWTRVRYTQLVLNQPPFPLGRFGTASPVFLPKKNCYTVPGVDKLYVYGLLKRGLMLPHAPGTDGRYQCVSVIER